MNVRFRKPPFVHLAYPKLSAPVLGFSGLGTSFLEAFLDPARMRR
jgi:hypothetical protein